MPKGGNAAPTNGQDSVVEANSPEEINAEEIRTRYRGQWLLLEITAFGDRGRMERVRVLARSMQRKALTKAVKKAYRENPGVVLTVFAADTILNPTKEDLRRAIEQARREEIHVTPTWEAKYADLPRR